jgi:D-arabinose 1-dehydrogenase-like Zn-dependent alcohol dehydrogenase
VGVGSPGSQIIVYGALGLGVHVTQKLGVSEANMFGVTESPQEDEGREARTLLR